MTNEKLIEKMSQDMRKRNFFHYTYEFYTRKTKDEQFNEMMGFTQEELIKLVEEKI